MQGSNAIVGKQTLESIVLSLYRTVTSDFKCTITSNEIASFHCFPSGRIANLTRETKNSFPTSSQTASKSFSLISFVREYRHMGYISPQKLMNHLKKFQQTWYEYNFIRVCSTFVILILYRQ